MLQSGAFGLSHLVVGTVCSLRLNYWQSVKPTVQQVLKHQLVNAVNMKKKKKTDRYNMKISTILILIFLFLFIFSVLLQLLYGRLDCYLK